MLDGLCSLVHLYLVLMKELCPQVKVGQNFLYTCAMVPFAHKLEIGEEASCA